MRHSKFLHLFLSVLMLFLLAVSAMAAEVDPGAVTISEDDYAATVNGVGYSTLNSALAAVTDDSDTVTVLKSVTENLTAYLRGNIVTTDGAEVTITATNDGWVYCPYTFVLGEGITLNIPNVGIFCYSGGTVIQGTVVTKGYYQMYPGTRTTIQAPGSMTVQDTNFVIGDTDGDPNAGLYIIGDNNDETIELNIISAYFYQGMISAKDATIRCQTCLYMENEEDGTGSANLVLDNSKWIVPGPPSALEAYPSKINGNSYVTLKNGAVLQFCKSPWTGELIRSTTTSISADETSQLLAEKITVVDGDVRAKIGDQGYTSVAAALDAAYNAGMTDVTITIVGENNASTADRFDMYNKYQICFDNVTLRQEDNSKPYYFSYFCPGWRTDEDGKFTFDGVNLRITGTFYSTSRVDFTNNSVVAYNKENSYIFDGSTVIEPGSQYSSWIEIVTGNASLIVDGGKTDGTISESVGYKTVDLTINENNTVILKNGAYAIASNYEASGNVTVNGTLDMQGARLDAFNGISIGATGSLKLNKDSRINMRTVSGTGKIVLDVAGMEAGIVEGIKADLSGFTGTIELVNGGRMKAVIENGKIVLSIVAARVVYTINGEFYAEDYVVFGEEIPAPAYETPAGHTFSGWEVPSAMPTEDITVDATLTVNSYTVTYDANGGSAVASETALYGAKFTKPADPVKAGYTFTGWYLGNERYNFGTETVTGDIELRAGWDFIWVDTGATVTFKVGTTYELTGQSGVSKNQNGDILISGVSGTIDPNRVLSAVGSDPYYQFVGWAIKNEDGTLEMIDLKTYQFKKATTVYAVTEDIWPVYDDMKQDRSDWFYSYVRELSVRGVINGYEDHVIKPQGTVTWGEALKMILLATGFEEQDSAAEHWAAGYLAKAEQEGMVALGTVTDLDKPLTRLEYAQVAALAMGLKDVDIDTPFADTDDQKVLNLYDAKIIEGSFDEEGNRLFNFDDNITRAEMFTIIWRICNYR